ncbi:5-hydroxytryptamine receptor 3E-like [Fundulus diaphanus]
MKIYAILDVRETDQTFIAYIWIYLRWDNEYVWWYPEQFCGVKHILVPTKLLWMPDLTIEEMTEQDKAAPSPYLSIRSHGWVEFRNDQVVVSTCKMRVYKFPFDMQSCNISFKSIMHSDEEIKLFYNSNNTEITDWSRKTMQTQYEWLFVSMTVTTKTVNHFGFNQTMIVYTINMKRRSVLYIANFLLPVLFFLCLDFASLLMSDTSGEKVGFKITVLLAVTVMQLILNEILPSSSDKIPLIAVYCIGTFALMLLSLLETILVSHLIDKDASQETEGEKTNCPTEDPKFFMEVDAEVVRDLRPDLFPEPALLEAPSQDGALEGPSPSKHFKGVQEIPPLSSPSEGVLKGLPPPRFLEGVRQDPPPLKTQEGQSPSCDAAIQVDQSPSGDVETQEGPLPAHVVSTQEALIQCGFVANLHSQCSKGNSNQLWP